MSTSPTLSDLAHSLGVRADALEVLGVKRDSDAHGLGRWLIPERDATGEIIGHATRDDDGNKRCLPGSKRGLTFSVGSLGLAGESRERPILIVEGMSDAAAGLSADFSTVGRPSATGGADLLAELVKRRHVVIVGERDRSGIGEKAAYELARKLETPAASVRIILPPPPAKDLRAWLRVAGGSKALGDAVRAAIADAPATGEAEKSPRERPDLIRLSDVEPAAVRWLWPGRVPLGRMTLLVGRPGEGKSFVTADMAARVSCGRDWPDGSLCPHGSVLLLAAEDDPADTLAPRLLAHDADRSRIHLLAGVLVHSDVGEDVRRVLTLGDLAMLRRTLAKLGDVRLIVIDPIGSYLGGRIDAHRDNEVRGVLAPAAALAEECGAALLVVAHTRKSPATFADDTALGSRAFTGLAGSVLHLITDPDDEDMQRRLLLPGKCNLAERAKGLAFKICRPKGAMAETLAAAVHWEEGEVTITADEAINREPARKGGDARTEREEAADWLRELLAEGPKPAEAVKAEAKGAEITVATLRRASKLAGVKSRKAAFDGGWWWCLPGQTPPEGAHSVTEDAQAAGREHLRDEVSIFGTNTQAAPAPSALIHEVISNGRQRSSP